MKPFPISTAMLVVSVLLTPTLLALSPDSPNQSAVSPAASAAEVPRLIKFSGTLLDAQDRPLAGPVGVQFKLGVAGITNDTTTGTVLNELAKYNPANTVSVTSAGDAGGTIGIVMAGAGIAPAVPQAIVATVGEANCVLDNTAVNADYLQISPTAAGQCHDSGATYPTSGQVLGRVTDPAKVPTKVYPYGVFEVRGLPPVYNVSGTLQSGHVLAGSAALSGAPQR